MEQEDVIRRLKGLGRGNAPPAPDFGDATLPVAAGRSGRIRFGMAPLAAVVGVLALGTAALAVPQGGPLRQVVAGFSTEVHTDVADVEADVDVDLNESGGTGSAGTDLCAGPPATVTVNDDEVGTPEGGGVEAGASVEIDPEDREAQLRAWREWRQANCDMTTDSDDGSGDSDGGNGRHGGNPPDHASNRDKGSSGSGSSDAHPHEDDPCHGPPPHSNKPSSGDPERDEAQRKAEQQAWQDWHRENCPPGQNGERGQGHNKDAGKPDHAGEGRPEDKGKPEGSDGGRPEDTGKPEDSPGRGNGRP